MSRRKPGRRRPESPSARPPEHALLLRAAWMISPLLALLATAVSAFLYSQITSPQSMLGAMSKAEYYALDPRGERPQTDGYPRVRWTDVARARDEALAAHPDRSAHVAIARLLQLTADICQGKQDPLKAIETARSYAVHDPQNLVVRLAEVILADQAATARVASADWPALPSPLERFERMRAVMEAAPRVRHTTLYHTVFTTVWRDVLRRYIRRPDVAASIAAAIPPYQVSPYRLALPLIQQRLTALAVELRAAGQPAAADTCAGWAGRLLLDLMAAETDSGTRLLCADLLADVLGRGSSAAERLVQLRADLFAAAARHAVDKSDFVDGNALDAGAYNAALRSLVGACAFLLSALGAAALLAVTGAAGVVRAVIRRNRPATSVVAEERRMPLYAKMAVAILPTLFAALLLIANLAMYGWRAAGWGVLCAFVVGVTGATAAAVLAGLSVLAGRPAQRWRLLATVALALMAVAVTAVPAPAATSAYRAVDLAVGAAWLLIAGTLAVLAAAVLLTPARWRTLARAAVFVWCLNAVLGLVVFQFHRVADRHYQQTVVAGRLDEFTARLGPDWQEKYLGPARRTLTAGNP